MNENINLCEILKDAPKGTKLYSPLSGDLYLHCVDEVRRIIATETQTGIIRLFSYNGAYLLNYPDAECLLFPSKDQRDWSKFKIEPPKVKATLHPFDRLLGRDDVMEKWRQDFLKCESYEDFNEGIYYPCFCSNYKYIIPYNKETANLLGTTDPCPIDYEIKFSKEYKE